MKKLFFALLFILMITPSFINAETTNSIRVSALAGNTGLALVRMMNQPSTLKYPTNFEIFKNPDLAVGKLIAGETDIAGLPVSTAVLMYNKGVEIQMAAVIGWGLMYMVSSDKTIRKWSDLRGKEIYISSKGAISDIILRYLISQNGLDPERDVKIQYITSAVEIAQLVAAGKVSIAALPEPWVTEVLLKNQHLKVILDFQKEWRRVEKQGGIYPQTCIVVRKQFAEEHPEAMHSFLKELKDSILWVNNNPKAAGVLAEKYVQIAAPAVEKGIRRINLKYNEAFKSQSSIEYFIQKLVQFAPESVGGKLPDERFYYHP